MAHQALFYERASGKILAVEPNLTITKANQKERYVPGRSHKEIGVYYLDGAEVPDPSGLVLRPSGNFGAPMLVDRNGEIIGLARQIESAALSLEYALGVVYECEGGLGDNLLQAAALLEWKGRYPEKWAGLSFGAAYSGVIDRIQGLDLVAPGILSPLWPVGTKKVNGRTEYMTDPRGIGFGKVSLYGTRLGLSSVQRVAKIRPTPEDIHAGADILYAYQREKERPLIGIQFRSASGHGKSWTSEGVADLVHMIYEQTEAECIIFGRDWEYSQDQPLGINFSGPHSWAETYQAALYCDFFICVDSGFLHLARSLEKPYICLWGGSTAEYILGEKMGFYDIRLDLPCKDRLCMECAEGHQHCMRKIGADLVFEKVKGLLRPAQIIAPKKRKKAGTAYG